MAKKQSKNTATKVKDDAFCEALELFRQSKECWADNRARYVEDVTFARLGEQWPEKVKAEREKDGRPCLTINKLPAFIRQVVNDARQNKPGIKVRPVDGGADVKTADVMSGIIRMIEHSSNADVAYDTSLEAATSGGFGFFRVDINYSDDASFDQDIVVLPVDNPLSVYPDAMSKACDSSDWGYCFVVEMITTDEHKARYPGKDISSFDLDDTQEMDSDWADGELVQVAEFWQVEKVTKKIHLLSSGDIITDEMLLANRLFFDDAGIKVEKTREVIEKKVTQRIMNGHEFLTEATAWAGKYIPIIPVYGEEINLEGERTFKSLVSSAKDAQRMFNFWRTASTELVALAPKAPFIGPAGAFDTDADKWATANSESHSYIEYDGNIPPTRQPFSGVPSGALQEALSASDDMKAIIGIYDSSLGARSNETSGKAILARQREADVGTFHFTDNLTRAIRHAGRIIIDLIPKVISKAQVVKIMGLDGESESVKVNEKFVDGEGVETIYNLGVGRYDLTCEAGPSYATQRVEAAESMTEFVRVVPQSAQLIGDLIAKNMDWPGAEEISERLRLMLPPQIQEKDSPIPPHIKMQMDQMSQQMQQMGQVIQQLQAENAKIQQDQEAERRKVDIDAYNAETNRLKAVGTSLKPEDIQGLVVQTMQQVISSPDILPPSPEQPVRKRYDPDRGMIV